MGKNPTEVEIMHVVKEVVLNINELNDEHDYFIETMEREDLYEFIDTAKTNSWLRIRGRYNRRMARMVKVAPLIIRGATFFIYQLNE